MIRQAQVRGNPGGQRSGSSSLPAPIRGINARDSIAAMKPEDAVSMDNMFPTPTSVDLRRGYTNFGTFTGQCESIIVYTGLASTKVFPCVVNGATRSIYDGTSGGALSSAVVGGAGATIEALTSTRFDYQNFGTIGGQFLSAVNGADTPLQYDGTNWIASLIAPPAATGTTAELFTNAVYAERLWFGRKNTFDVCYLPVNSITGTLVRLNLASLFKLGGSLNSIVTLTDNSNTLTDYIGFLSTEGELVAFTGTDPSSATTWARVAHMRIGRPVIKGNRSWCKYGADALVLCADGIIPLRSAIAADKRDLALAISDRIRPLLNSDLIVNGTRNGWALCLHPTGSKLIVNVPTLENATARQWVMNTQHGAWAKFTGWNAFCFESARDQLYFGGNGVLAKADQSSAQKDNTTAISVDVKQAFSYFSTRGRTKHMKAMRPILALNGPVNIAFSVDTNYTDMPPSNYIAVGGTTGDPWGGLWDAVWGGSAFTYATWNTITGIGHAIAPRMKMLASDIELSWSASDFLYEVGGPLG